MGRNRTSGSNAKLESDSLDAPLRAKKTSRLTSPVRVVVTHYRRRLLDPDNLSIKAVLDAIRRTSIISDDSPEQITEIVHRQVKAREEKTIIRIEEV